MQTGFDGLHLFALDFIVLHAPKAPLPGADSPYQGEMSRRDKRGRDAVSRRLTERLLQICIGKTQTANSVCGLERKKRAQRIRSLACKDSFRRGRF